MPANDGTRRGWFALLEEDPQGLRVTLRGLNYDDGAAAAQMAAHGLKTGYADCLMTGLWPSQDVLPEEERAARGQPLEEKALVWSRA